MPDTNIDSAEVSDINNLITNYSVDSVSTDGANGQKEFTWQMTEWETDYGYYLSIPEFKTAIDAKANWTLGAGFTTDEATSMLLGTIKGNGKDSFNSILKNMIKIKTIAGDAFAEIVRNDDGVLTNLKPLDPSSMMIVQNDVGQIIRYEQVSKVKDKANKKFEPDEILHLSHERMADEIHGVRIIKSLKWLILARNEAMNDWQRVLHRNIDPLWIFHLDTDDPTEINTFKTKMDTARTTGENMYIPKGAVVPEMVTTAANSTLNPVNWINQLNDYFFQAVNVPQIIIGNAKEFTDASGKIVYLAYEQSVKTEQLYIEEQILNQLNIEIQLTFPASLQQDAVSDDGSQMQLQNEPMEQATQPNDTMVEMEGKQ